ncbi:hypothetical protein FQR65_LT15941 [Abscondita terminalis]|nr:hypothetical protein FQR65_LT15941 [Abscondita terminalis]
MASISERVEVSEFLVSLLNRLKIVCESFENDTDFAKGANHTGEIIKLWVNGRDEKEQKVELCLLLKIALRDISSRKIFSIESSYGCESFVYETIFTLFARMQDEAKIEDRFESYPKYYSSSTKAMEELIVLENLTSFKVVDRSETLTYHQARILAKEIGKLHALANKKLEEEEYVKFAVHWIGSWNSRYLDLFDSELMRETVRTLIPAKIREMFARHYSFDPDDVYGVIGHCDLWSSNLLFNEQEVRIIDWQTSRVCSPAVDLSQILFSCCDGEVRNKHKQDLIQAYYDSCSEMLMMFGEDPNATFPRAILQKHLETYSGYALSLALRTVTLISVPKDEIPDTSMSQSYAEVTEKYMTVNLNSNIFDKRIRDILTDYVSYGYDI